jgi:hypothetical protein
MRDWSKIPKQTQLSENGVIGDCWRCCIAAVLGLPAEEVPHFQQLEPGKSNNECDADTQRWLTERGYRIMYANVMGRSGLIYPVYHSDTFVHQTPPIIAVGPTPRSKGMGRNHAIVTIGGQMVYDPHPSEAGLTAILENYLIFRPVE